VVWLAKFSGFQRTSTSYSATELQSSSLPSRKVPPYSFETCTQVSMQDTTPPSLVSTTVSSSSLDIGAGETSLLVTAHFTDDLSGIFDGTYADGSGGSSAQILFTSPSGQSVVGVFDILHPISGSRLDGYYQARITLGTGAEAGVWKATSLLLNDEAGNVTPYSAISSALAT
jgi:hypothetical protein